MQQLHHSQQNMTEAQLMADLIQIRRDTASNWTSADTVLAQGEQGYETDTGKMKVGDGSTAWSSLSYFGGTTLSDLNVTATSTELNYVDGVTSAIQTQLDAKAETLTDLGITDGTDGQVLTTDGSGTFTFATASGGGGGSFEATASGTLANGDTVIVNADGTVSAVAQVVQTAAVGTQVQMTTGNANSIAGVSIGNNKIAICYRDYNNSNYGTAVIGTISDTTISFGTPVVFYSSTWNTNPAIVWHPEKERLVVFGPGLYGFGYGYVASVSGTTLSFNSTSYQIFNSTVTYYSSVYDPTTEQIVVSYRPGSNNSGVRIVTVDESDNSLTFGTLLYYDKAYAKDMCMTNDGKIVIAYIDDGDSSRPKAIVGTISGTTISVGSIATINTSHINSSNIKCVFDTNENKVVIVYVYNADGYGTVGTVSGTSISYGSVNAWDTDATQSLGLAFDSNTNKTIVTGRHNSVQELREVTISGNSLSFSDPVNFSAGGDGTFNVAVYDSSSQRVAIIYSLSQTTGYANVYRPSGSTTNLTAENYIGISDGAYSDGATATVQIVGSVDDAQSGLTPGQAYYVQAGGTLSTDADTPSVFAGTAVAATKLIVKG